MKINKLRLIPIDYSSLEYITKKKDFAQIVGVHPNTVAIHNKLARVIFPEYRKEDDLHKALTRYMFWVLWHVQFTHAMHPRNKELAKQVLIKNRHLFTKNKFKWHQNQNPNYTINLLLKGAN